MEIRPARPADRAAIDGFAEETVHDTYDQLVDVEYADDLLANWWGSALDEDIAAGRVLLAVDGERVVGLAQTGEIMGTPVLWKLYVAPGTRSAGLGAALVDAVVGGLPTGTERLVLEHLAANVDAARFHRRHGFRRIRVEEHEDPRRAVIWRARDLRASPGSDDGPGHGHDQTDWSEVADDLVAWDRALEATHADLATWLEVRPGERVIDIGSGAGGFAATLADRVQPAGSVTLLDTSPELLALARGRLPATVEVSTVAADLDAGPLPEELAGRFDLVHAGHVVHHTDDQRRTIRALVELLAPGGRLAVREGGLPTRFLPSECGLGEPDLETRLQAASVDWFWDEIRPAGPTRAVDAGWGALLADAGLSEVESRTFLVDHPPPLRPDLRRLVARSLSAMASRLGDRLAPDDRAAIAALCDPSRPDGVHQRPDVFILAARTVHVGVLPS